eukprot:CAMPEP_0113444314 /NCGR_PEP_ID=MMETSP0014_2-20120614/2603_1 /TAXON_ID=2857 /ORGANISM="Nitzschia sp." /LENGTH=152 /DNA_ID=CAMNT_0000335323 /DNA_START=1 /DNA_END=457 /DNA_ORIENTATION=+ /assembly_acc=CAM_ASM_000159
MLDATGRDLVIDESKIDGDGGISTASPGGGRCSVVHGMLVAALFSSIFGCIAPGCVYLNQTLDFKKPVYVGDTVAAGSTLKGYDHGGKKEPSSNVRRMFIFTDNIVVDILITDRTATTILQHSKKKEATLLSLAQQLYGSLLVHDHQSKDER